MNQRETTKIKKALAKIGFSDFTTDNTIIWHGRIPYNGCKKYRNDKKDLLTFSDNSLVHFEAGINHAGVGDGKKPEKALTYSITFCNYGECKGYRRKYTYECELIKFHNYNRKLQPLIDKFIQFLVKN